MKWNLFAKLYIENGGNIPWGYQTAVALSEMKCHFDVIAIPSLTKIEVHGDWE